MYKNQRMNGNIMNTINAASIALNAVIIAGMAMVGAGYANTNNNDLDLQTTIETNALQLQQIVIVEVEVEVEKEVFVNEMTATLEAERAAFINNPHADGQTPEFCMAQNIFFEAGIDNLAGMSAVANTVLNRVDSNDYPDTVCGVIHQGKRDAKGNMVRHQCQFSWYCDGKSDRIPESENWERAKEVAWDILNANGYRGLVEGATHYHATYVSPYWSNHADMTEVGQIGQHIFYRWDA